MIIDEGFLSNAKKIAAENPQNSKVKAPVIRRENFEYHIEIKSVSEIRKERILSCEMIKECGNFSESGKKGSYIIQFDSDLFVSPDSVYEFISRICGMTTIIITGSDGNEILKYSRSMYMNMSDKLYIAMFPKNCLISLRTYKESICMFRNMYIRLGGTDKGMTGWMLRNRVMIPGYETFDEKTKRVYPVKASAGDIKNITDWNSGDGRISVCFITYDNYREYEVPIKTVDVSGNGKFRADDVYGSLLKSGMDRYIFYYESNDGNEFCVRIRSLFPVLCQGRYIYISACITIQDTREYILIDRMMKENMGSSFVFSEVSTGNMVEYDDMEFIDMSGYVGNTGEDTDGYSTFITYAGRNVDDNVENPDYEEIQDKVAECGLFSSCTDIYTSRIDDDGSFPGHYMISITSGKPDITADHIYGFVCSFGNDTYPKISIIRNSDCSIFISEEIDEEYKIIKNSLNPQDYVVNMENLMIGFGVEHNDMIRWETENGIVRYNMGMMLYSDSPEYVFGLVKNIHETYIMDDRYNTSGITEDDLMKTLGREKVNEYILMFTEIQSYAIQIKIRTMYPVMISGKYVYAYITSERYYRGSDTDERFMYFNDFFWNGGSGDKSYKYGKPLNKIKFLKIEPNGKLTKNFHNRKYDNK